jgi:hypothetical protein
MAAGTENVYRRVYEAHIGWSIYAFVIGANTRASPMLSRVSGLGPRQPTNSQSEACSAYRCCQPQPRKRRGPIANPLNQISLQALAKDISATEGSDNT